MVIGNSYVHLVTTIPCWNPTLTKFISAPFFPFFSTWHRNWPFGKKRQLLNWKRLFLFHSLWNFPNFLFSVVVFYGRKIHSLFLFFFTDRLPILAASTVLQFSDPCSNLCSFIVASWTDYLCWNSEKIWAGKEVSDTSQNFSVTAQKKLFRFLWLKLFL